MSPSFERVCNECGFGLLLTDRFCANCGNPAPEANPKRHHSIVAVLVFGLGLTALIVVLIALKQDGSIGAGASGDETSRATSSRGRCDGAGTYAHSLASWQESVRSDLQEAGFYEDGSWQEMPTSEEFAAMATILNDRVGELDDLTAPESGRDFHDEFHKSMDLFGDLLNSARTDGYLAGPAYAGSIERQDAKLSEAAVQFEIECNLAVSDEDNDGINEIGWGANAST
jgi:hypothetical protein